MKLSVVIPVYNEKHTILEVLERVRSVNLPKEMIIVDDCSTDGTRDILKSIPPSENIKVILQPENMGKGAALRAGFSTVSGDIVVVQDADLEYDPAEYANLIQPILANKADVVFGSRFLGGPHRVLLFWHSVGNGKTGSVSSRSSRRKSAERNAGFMKCPFPTVAAIIRKGRRSVGKTVSPPSISSSNTGSLTERDRIWVSLAIRCT